jgi:hypothetical protein
MTEKRLAEIEMIAMRSHILLPIDAMELVAEVHRLRAIVAAWESGSPTPTPTDDEPWWDRITTWAGAIK